MSEPTIRRAGDPDTITVSGPEGEPVTVERPIGPIASLLDGENAVDADHASVQSGDGLFTASIPLSVLRTAALDGDGRLAIDEPPTRCWLVKDVRRIELTIGRRPDSLPPEERAKA